MSIRVLLGLVVVAFLTWLGVQRRRGVWTARSWRRFAALVGVVVCAFGATLAMAAGVDRGIYQDMPPWADRLYLVVLMTLIVLTPLAGVGLLLWFARGRADRQLG